MCWASFCEARLPAMQVFVSLKNRVAEELSCSSPFSYMDEGTKKGTRCKVTRASSCPWPSDARSGVLADGARELTPEPPGRHVKNRRLSHPPCGEVSNVPSRVTGSGSQSDDGRVRSENSHFVEKDTEAQRDAMTCPRFVPKSWGTQAGSQATPSLAYPALRHWTRRWPRDGRGAG